MKKILLALFCLPFALCAQELIQISENLELIPIGENTYVHVSYATFEPFGRVASNGLIFINHNEAVIADTPATEESSTELLRWLDENNIIVKAVVVNHFHKDCLAGLNKFHERGIPSYGHELTRELAIKSGAIPPQHTFLKSINLKVGNEVAEARYFGEGHTRDNIILWIASEKILFGGCMIKSMGAGKGNVDDANLNEWSGTVVKVKQNYPHANFIVPGHGKYGSVELLDFTITLFEVNLKGG